MQTRTKQLVAVIVIAGLILTAVITFSIRQREAAPRADMSDLLGSRSVRAAPAPEATMVALGEPYLTLAATPVTMYYSEDAELTAAPLLISGPNDETPEAGASKAPARFLEAYGAEPTLTLGDPTANDTSGNDQTADAARLERTTVELARQYWQRADGAILVEPTQQGYELAINTVPIASYLNIPVIVTAEQSPRVTDALAALEVEYTIVCGDLPGYGRVWPMENTTNPRAIIATGVADPSNTPRALLGDRMGENASYIAVANPSDIVLPKVVDRFTKTFSGTVTSSDTGSTSFPTSSADAPTNYLTIPEDYRYARVTVDSTVATVEPTLWPGSPQDHGERSYVYFGTDHDRDGAMTQDEDSPEDRLHFMVPSLGYAYEMIDGTVNCIGHADFPIFNSTGEKCVQIKATLDQKPVDQFPGYGPGTAADARASSTSFSIEVTVEKLESYHYPRMPYASSLAPYLAAFRRGVVLAESDFTLHNETFASHPNSGDPAVNFDLYPRINHRAAVVKDRLNALLASIAGMGDANPTTLATHYGAMAPDAFCVGIVADTNMVPWYYYHNTGQVDYGESEGYHTPSDNGYADIDLDLANAPYDRDGSHPSMELAVGRITGWDAQDTSALLARTFFYDRIVGAFAGQEGAKWTDSAMTTHGDAIPVESAKTVTEKLDEAFDRAGFTVNSFHDLARSDSKLSSAVYERSNLIFECAHGYYYWYVPPGYKATGPGGGFHVANVKNMEFGPSVLYASSCVTGKIDGIPHTNALSQAFLHSGMNTYVGASRLSWGGAVPLPDAESGEILGGYLGQLFYGYLTGYIYNKDGGLIEEGHGDLTVGQALILAKNKYISRYPPDDGGPDSDTVEEFNIFGDPAFNPYEPNHDG